MEVAEFRSWRSFSQFQWKVRKKHRYIPDEETKDFLDALRGSSHDHEYELKLDSTLYRAQLGNEWIDLEQDGADVSEPAPFQAERMKPKIGSASEGRVNPKGIPYLYLAENQETAMSETRPWIGSLISVALFESLKDLSLVDCTVKARRRLFLEEPNAEQRKRAVWSDIDQAFSCPVTSSDDLADYVPTQIVAELFKSEGFDGIRYTSSLGKGRNIVLFDVDVVRLVKCGLYKTEAVRFDFCYTEGPFSVWSCK